VAASVARLAPAPPERDEVVPGIAAPGTEDEPEPEPPTRSVPAYEAPAVPAQESPAMARPATEPAEVLQPAPAVEEPADPPAAEPESPAGGPAAAVPGEAEPVAERPSARTGIRYAGGLGKPSKNYWDAEESHSQLAGLVYTARSADQHPGADAEETDPGRGAASATAGRQQPPELEDDAPPFGTAPFAAVPRLNRVRSMPAPPADGDDEDE
jgi:hypothetical protein